MPEVGGKVQFKSGTLTRYNSITPDSNTIYFTVDSNGKGRIFVGDQEYCSSESNSVTRSMMYYYKVDTPLDPSNASGYRVLDLVPEVSSDDVQVGDCVIDCTSRVFEITSFILNDNVKVRFLVRRISSIDRVSSSPVYVLCDSSSTTLKRCYSPKFLPIDGSLVTVKFTMSGVSQGATLNINYSQDYGYSDQFDYPIYFEGQPIESNIVRLGSTSLFVFSDGKYHLLTSDYYIDKQAEDILVIS